MAVPPAVMGLNTPRRFYRGGARILEFRGLPRQADFDDHRPEDWLGSTTRLFAEGGDGLTTLPDGTPLSQALAADPESWLGPEHLAAHGAEPGLLVKLLDAAERLPVHVHPDRAFAARHLDCAHGKTEAWLVLDAEPGARVWVGFRDEMPEDRLTGLVDAQDDGLLAALNGFTVERGDAVLVPAGQPHAIGAGVFVVELQEPTDFSVMLENERFGLDPAHAWLGLDRTLALRSVERQRLAPTSLAALCTRWDGAARPVFSALPAAADPFFRAEVLDARHGEARTDAGFSVLVVVEGAGELTTAAGDRLAVRAGETVLAPYACGELTLTGEVAAVRCRPGHDTPDQVGATAPAGTH